jgi:hypothetical protein
MNKLDPTERSAVAKMSTERLRIKLGKADFEEQLVAEMSREQLLEAWAECVATGRDKPSAIAARAAPTVGYDVELEKQRLVFETRRFEAELALRQEEIRMQKERDAVQLEERLALYKLHEQELHVKQQQWEWQKLRDTREAEKQNSPAARVKFFGDVLKNVMPRFPTDVADIPIYFEGIEKLFISFEVPSNLRAKLLLPYLSEKAKSLLLRLEQSKQEKYDDVKTFLLNEFRLTPVQFKDKFERAMRIGDETFTMFCSRLKNLLMYYCRSRQVDNYDSLFSLLVADKIKTLLPEACLDHVLTVEGNSWLKCEELANTIDTYFANHTHDGRPRSGNNDCGSKQVNSRSISNWNKSLNVADVQGNPQSGNPINLNPTNQRQNSLKQGGQSQQQFKNVLCYICQSPNHKQINCPSKGNIQGKSGMGRGTARNYACNIETHTPTSRLTEVHGLKIQTPLNDISTSEGSGVLQATNQVKVSPVNCHKDGTSADVRACDGVLPRVDNVTVQALSDRPISTVNNMIGDVAPEPGLTFHSARAAISTDDLQHTVVDGLSKLKYVSVNIHGISGIHTALHDNGSEINLINREFVEQLPQLSTIGRIKIKGVVGPAVETDLTLLDVSPSASESDCINIAPPLREVFAICDGLNENIILTADTVQRLATLRNYESLVATTVIHDGSKTNDDVICETNDRIDDVTIDIDSETEKHDETDLTSADTITLMEEQRADPALAKYFDMVRNGNKQFFIRDGILYHRGKVNGNKVDQLCLPLKRVETVLKIAHDLPYSGHQAIRRTNDRISMSFYFPGQLQRVKDYCNSCNICQLRARERRTDLVPIKPIDRHEDNFGHLQADIIGPMGGGVYKYALVLTDVQSRYVNAFELHTPTAKNVVDKIILHSSLFGLPRYISFDCGTHFTSELTKACLNRLGVSPRFHCPYNPRAAGLVERSNATLKQIISKLAEDMPASWHKVLPFALWSLRTSVNETLGISPYQAVFGQQAIGPLQLLCDDWTGKRPLPLDIAKAPAQYLRELERRLEIASEYTAEHAAREQTRYTQHYNLRSRDKHFEVGEQVIYLMPSSTHKLTRTWIGPCIVMKKNSPYSYIIEVNGKQQWCHANHLRKYNERVNSAACHNCAIIFDTDQEFGYVPTLTIQPNENTVRKAVYASTHVGPSVSDNIDPRKNSDESSSDVDHPMQLLEDNDDVTRFFSDASLVRCSKPIDIVTKIDQSTSKFIERIDANKLQHLDETRKMELLHVLNEFSDCFSETPGFCPYVEHKIVVSPEFKPKRLREYRIPEILKPEIQRQIDELVKMNFIRPSNSPMASPIVAVLKGPTGQGGVRLTIDFRYLNQHSQNDAFVMPHLQDTIQKVGAARYVTVFDAKSGYWQLGLREEDRWLSAFAYDGGLYEWCRLPFGMRTSGNTFCRCVQLILEPIRDFCFAFVDDMSVCSNDWVQHLSHLRSYLTEIRKSGLTLSLKKCSFAQNEVRFVGHIIGSGRHRPDETKLSSVVELNRPTTKKDVRRMVGFFSYFRSYIPHLAELSAPFTNLLAKGRSNLVEWGDTEETAFQELKRVLCECVKANLYIAQWGQPFGIHTDASSIAVGSCLVQWDSQGKERPIAFASSKLTGAQLAWAAVEKEAYAVVWSLNKFRTWIFGAPITIFADCNPLTFLTASAPKSAKLTRWALALQEFQITFKYKRGTDNVVPDYLSRPC